MHWASFSTVWCTPVLWHWPAPSRLPTPRFAWSARSSVPRASRVLIGKRERLLLARPFNERTDSDRPINDIYTTIGAPALPSLDVTQPFGQGMTRSQRCLLVTIRRALLAGCVVPLFTAQALHRLGLH